MPCTRKVTHRTASEAREWPYFGPTRTFGCPLSLMPFADAIGVISASFGTPGAEGKPASYPDF